MVVGARPNYFKAKPLLAQLDACKDIEAILVHTGQHYDPALYQDLFAQLDLRPPDVYLGVEGARLPVAAMIQAFSAWLADAAVDAVVVVGDVDSTASSAISAHYAGIPVAHVEAGLRSGDRSMPEEINRLITDAVSDLLLVSDPVGIENLRREGRSDEDMTLIGNVMIDTLLERLPAAKALALPPHLAARIEAGSYGLVTLHRPGNVDDAALLGRFTDGLLEVSKSLPLVFPIHPRTRKRLVEGGLLERLSECPTLTDCDPLGYLETIALQAGAAVVLSDSAGITEESSVLGRPCLTLRPNTERPITLERGTSVLVPDPGDMVGWVERALSGDWPQREGIELWDGKASVRALAALRGWLGLTR
ncbi:MAG: UDP-N-acetylglucosamine 2-epimerase (non-hydrolyzing) [Planctomycetes bacterium]|nr:UDP-N-acetylglucosamine 2-epimerase (non-hydrolyzing) [Planctomycetota bacterium]